VTGLARAETGNTGGRWRGYVGWGLLVLFVGIGLRPPGEWLTPDQAIYSLIGREVLQGAVPYRDLWDNKGPAMLFAYTSLAALFGSHQLLYELFFLTVWTGWCVWAAYLLGKTLGGALAGRWAALLLLFATSFPLARELNAEMVALPFVLTAANLLLTGMRDGSPWRLVGAGVGLAIAVWTKPVYCFDLLAALLAVMAWTGGATGSNGKRPGQLRRVLGMLGLLFAGVGVVSALILGYFAVHGAVGDLWRVSVLSNVTYMDDIPLAEAARGALKFMEDRFLVLVFVWGPAVVGLGLLWMEVRPRHERVLMAAWLGLAILGMLVGRRYFPHYQAQPLAPAVVLAGLALSQVGAALHKDSLEVRKLAKGFLVFWALVLAVPLLSRTYNAAHDWRVLGRPDPFVSNEVATAEYLTSRTRPGDSLFVVGMNCQLPLLTGLKPASRFLYTRFLYEAGDGPVHEDLWRRWEQDMERSKPAYIVLSNYNHVLELEPGIEHLKPLREMLQKHYRLDRVIRGVGTPDYFYNTLYRRCD
jgi:4-amino-4-deoxy-L-arabinose transferase-like glycosyltransferase